MKILFLTNLSDQINGFYNILHINKALNCSGTGLGYPLNLLYELSEYATVHIYSPPFKEYVQTKSILTDRRVEFLPQKIAIPQNIDAVEVTENKDYDIVIAYAESIHTYMRNFENIKPKKVLWFLSSPQQILLPAYKDVYVDLYLTVVDKAGRTDFGKEFQKRNAKWLPLSVDERRFHSINAEKKVDFCLLGNLNPYIYPFRLQMFNYLLGMQNLDGAGKYSAISIPQYGESYVLAIAMSRIFATCSGIWKFPVMKYFEALACGTLLMADTPIDAEELGFKLNENFVSVDQVFTPKIDNPSYPVKEEEWNFDGIALKTLVDHYLTHVDDNQRIASAGEKLVASRHTDKIRAKELYGMLENL